MNKVDSIKLATTSPLGAQTIGGGNTPLSDFDLIVIAGPNGSGKTTLATALADLPHGVQVVDRDGAAVTLDGKADVEMAMLTRSGSALMGPFLSLNEALAAASGVAAIRDDKKLLALLVATNANAPHRLARFLPTAANTQDPELGRKIDDYLAVERRAIAALGSDRPLTRESFDEIGREVAQRLGLTWQMPATVRDDAMRAAEDAVRPRASEIAGDVALRNAIATAIAGLATGRARPLIDQIKDAAAALQESINGAAALAPLAADEATPADDQWEARCERFATVDDAQVATLKKERQALDMLGTIRKQAEQWISQHQPDHCPVCSSQIDRNRLLADLRDASEASGRIAEIDRTIKELAGRASALRQAAQEIARRTESVRQAQRGASVLLKQWSDAIDALKSACVAATGWHAEIVAMAGGVREACEKSLASPHWSGSGVEAVTEVVAIVGDLVSAITEVKRTREELEENGRRNLAPAESAFRRLGPLRELLVAREKLNAESWEPRWESAITDGLKRKVIERWQAAVRELIAELDAAESDANQRILGDKDVQARFKALCTASGHPLLVDADFDDRQVSVDGESIETVPGRGRVAKLSEGLRVIVNLAAFIAVSGHVCVGQQHQAGWIVLDEPTNGLDATNRGEVAKYLGGLSTDLMPRQMFITTFEGEFVTELLAAAKHSGRRTLLITLPKWTGAVPVTPTVTPR